MLRFLFFLSLSLDFWPEADPRAQNEAAKKRQARTQERYVRDFLFALCEFENHIANSLVAPHGNSKMLQS